MKRNVRDVCMPMILVHEALVKVGKLEGYLREEEKEPKDQEKCFCQYHVSTTDYSIQEYPDFFKLIQKMMNEGELELCEKIEE